MTRSAVFVGLATLVASVAGSAQAPPEVLLQPVAALREPFARLKGVVELRDGRVIVADQGEKSVYLADFGGRERVRLGRNGQGPAEYQSPVALFAGQADTALVYDLFNGRFAFATAEGIVGTLALRDVAPPDAFPQALDVRRRSYWDEVSHARLLKRAHPGSSEADEAPLIRSAAGRVDTLTSLAIPGPVNPGPIPEWDRWGVGEDGWVAVVRNQDAYRVDWIPPEGSLAHGPVVDESRVEVGRRDRARLETAGAGGAVIGRGSAPARQDAYVPARFPFALSIAVSPEREAWVRRALPGEDPPPSFDVFDTAGRRIGRYRLPAGRTLVGFGRGTLYATREDEVGLIWLERYTYPVTSPRSP